jgi:hypothetical protein
LTPRQFGDWANFYSHEPFGEERADMRMARIVWATLQTNRKQRLNERDYIFRFTNVQKPATVAEYQEKARRMYAIQNAKFK